MWHAWKGREMHKRVLVGNPEVKRLIGTPKRRLEGTVRIYLKKLNGRSWIGFIWLKTGTSDGPF